MNDIFKPSDFYFTGNGEFECEKIAASANRVLKEYAEKNWPVYYCSFSGLFYSRFYSFKTDIDTHKCRLAFIEPIEKPECKHKPNAIMDFSIGELSCKYCGVKLKMPTTWEAEI